jgi:hypothetical protein
MEEEIKGLKAALRSLAEEAQAHAGPHLEVEQLAAYHFEELPDDEAERVQDHLVMCRDCASRLLDLAAFCAPGEDELSQPPPTEFKPSFFQRLRDLIFPLRPAYALAALSLALSLSLAAWIISLRRQNQALITQVNQRQIARDAEAKKEIEEALRRSVEARKQVEEIKGELDKTLRERDELRKPQLNITIADLPLGETRAPGDPRPVIKPDAGGAFFILLIPDPPEPYYSKYAIEILDRNRAPVMDERGLRRDSEGGFTMLAPRQLFPPGEYSFNIYGLGRGGRTRVMGGVISIRDK